jgi:rubrerythrin
MADKPSYIGLLNAIAVAEGQAECYLQAWAGVTPSDDVRQVLTTIALREGEHSKAFEKRLCELGYSVKPKEDAKAADRAALATRTDLSDREKFERLGLVDEGDGPDVFTPMFADKSIDIQTGALLGRYIAEERDSGRMFRECYAQLTAGAGGNGQLTGGGADLSGQLARIETLLEKLVDRLPA